VVDSPDFPAETSHANALDPGTDLVASSGLGSSHLSSRCLDRLEVLVHGDVFQTCIFNVAWIFVTSSFVV
jgi:hypothetical protein